MIEDGNKSGFSSAAQEIYLMQVAPEQWKNKRKMNVLGYGGDHPEFQYKCAELGITILQK